MADRTLGLVIAVDEVGENILPGTRATYFYILGTGSWGWGRSSLFLGEIADLGFVVA
jgi:hypothetical protein